MDGTFERLVLEGDVAGLSPTAEQRRIHHALATRTVTPDEGNLRLAAGWLAALLAQHRRYPRYDDFEVVEVLADKAALVLRMAHRHVPALAVELERADSVLGELDAAARFVPPALGESALLGALRREIGGIELPVETPAGADVTWHENRRRLQDLILHDNPNRFLSWPVILTSMFMGSSRIAGPELAALRGRADFGARWEPALREDAFGGPARTPLHVASSNNLIHHAYNLLQLELHAGVGVERLSTILEFGGGYGSTARLATRLGFRGTYIIFDLPEFSALQRFYLGSLGMAVGGAEGAAGIRCISSAEALRALLPDSAADLFVATWSFSETPVEIRERFRGYVLGARRVLIAYQATFGEVDNLSYFAELGRQLGRHADYAIGHLANSRYLVGEAVL